jgi:hypothetical protein
MQPQPIPSLPSETELASVLARLGQAYSDAESITWRIRDLVAAYYSDSPDERVECPPTFADIGALAIFAVVDLRGRAAELRDLAAGIERNLVPLDEIRRMSAPATVA